MWVVFIPEIIKMASATRESFFPATVAGGGVNEAGKASADEAEA